MSDGFSLMFSRCLLGCPYVIQVSAGFSSFSPGVCWVLSRHSRCLLDSFQVLLVFARFLLSRKDSLLVLQVSGGFAASSP